ncbi:MAG: hypothetical protein JXA30_07785 [Deltaproteobacteria bacterium]|nr:hypothetical protein [Deltaproteobacteria bacterium]
MRKAYNGIEATPFFPLVIGVAAIVSAVGSGGPIHSAKANPAGEPVSPASESATNPRESLEGRLSEEALWERRFSGLWSLIEIIITQTELPVVGKLTAKTRIVSLFSLSFRNSRLVGSGKLCGMTVDSGTSLVTTRFPPSFVRALPPPEFNARLIRKEDQWRLYHERQYLVVGAKLKNERADQLPKTASDPRVFDQDNDGNPGVTVLIDGLATGGIFVTQRTWTELTGSLQAPGRFYGQLGYGNEQQVLDATAWYLKHPIQLKPAPDRSHFYLIRMGQSASCQEALRLAGFSF